MKVIIILWRLLGHSQYEVDVKLVKCTAITSLVGLEFTFLKKKCTKKTYKNTKTTSQLLQGTARQEPQIERTGAGTLCEMGEDKLNWE